MDIASLPTVSDKLYLSDIDPAFAELEGAVAEDQQVWVQIRKITERDHMARAELMNNRTMKWSSAFSEVVSDNPVQRRGYETLWTLHAIGNLKYDTGEPVFPQMPASLMTYSEFERIFGNLDPVVAGAIHKAVLKINPLWA